MWSPSSLIFLVLLGVWAAYFLQYWIRRRDHLATARSVEQFSEAMRVLERRDTTPRTDLSEPGPRSWSLHPARATTRPQVLVKRALPAEPSRRVVTAPVEPHVPTPGPSRSPASAGPERRPRRRGVRPSRRVRAASMLLALAGLVTVAVLVGLGVLLPWSVAPAVAVFVAAFAWVRSGVRAERALRVARLHHRADRSRRRPAAPATVRPSSRPGASAPVTTDDTAAPTGSDTEALAETASAETVYDDVVADAVADAGVSTAEEAVDEVEIEYVHLVDEDDIPLTWDPVPVPRPTYTMKARAQRPEVVPAEVTPEPEPVALPADEPVGERRVAGA